MRVLTFAIVLAAMISVGSGVQGPGDNGGPKAADTVAVSFKNDILPVFKHYCLPCHTEANMNPSELYLDTYANVIKGGMHGPPVVPGKPDSSLLIRKIGASPPFGNPMPMKLAGRFPDDQLQLLRAWIRQGARNK